MNRRAFIAALLAGAATMAIDPERLLWRPGAKKIFIPDEIIPDEITSIRVVSAGSGYHVGDLVTVADIDEIVKRHMVPVLVNNIFKPSPLFARLRGADRFDGGIVISSPLLLENNP